MKYYHYEIFSPHRDPSHTVVTPDVDMARRPCQLLERFEHLTALRDGYFRRAEKGARKVGIVERMLAFRDSGRNIKVADVVDWNDIDRAWRAHAVAGLVVAKLYALHHTAPGEVGQPRNQTDREPRLHALWRHASGPARAIPSASRQSYELVFYSVIQNSPQLAKFRPEVFCSGPRSPQGFPFKASLPE